MADEGTVAKAQRWPVWSGWDAMRGPSLGGGAHLHHQHDGVESDHGHDGVLKGWGHHELPHAVLEALLVLGHVPGQRLGTDGEVDAGPLWETPAHEKGDGRKAICSQPPGAAAQIPGSAGPRWAPHKD